ncbi:MAG: ABC transporter permease [Euryarchaeota archaeon]|nr:ABC transporter permease [Euryarchaeota archaeon]
MFAMFGRNRDVFLKTWKVNFIPPIVEPVLYLLALGYGLGALIEEVNGMPYVVFIAPALITITMMQSAFFETTYSSYVRMFFQKTWDAVVATPLTIEDIMVAELLWAGVRSVIYSTIMATVVALFGLLSFPSALLIIPIAFLVGMVFAGLGLMASAKVPAIDSFSYVFYLFITPQFLFSGTFFPLEQLPDPIEHAALALPLTNAVILVRSASLGTTTGLELFAFVYLVVAAFVFCGLAVGWMKRRLID